MKNNSLLISIALGLITTSSWGLDFKLPADQFGKANITMPQSFASLETLMDVNRENFEPVKNFTTRSRYRKYSRPVGRLDLLVEDRSGFRHSSFCTATIISEQYILTNYHCVPGDEPGTRVIKAQLRMGFLSPFLTGTTYPVRVSPVENSKMLDYSILKVDNNPSSQYGKVQLVLRDPEPNEELFIIHHPIAKPKRITRRFCRAIANRTLTNTDLRHRCDTLKGSSGSPIFSDNDLALVGLHYSGGLGGDIDSYNSAKRMTKIKQDSSIIQSLVGNSFRDLLQDGTLGPEMVWIPAGRFRMGDIQGGGDSDEKPVHWVSVSKFAMGRYEVTVGEFRQFVNATGYKTDAEKSNGCYVYAGSWDKKVDANWRNPYFSQTDNQPVVCVSRNDATAYAKWLSQQTGHQYRLPSEAEWEYAARAGTKTKYWWGNNIGKNRANCDGCRSQWDDKQTAPVGSFAPNQFGLYDTAGNVWEWIADPWHNNYNNAPSDGSIWKENPDTYGLTRTRVAMLRGGSWSSKPYYECRAATRGRVWIFSFHRHATQGFRVVMVTWNF